MKPAEHNLTAESLKVKRPKKAPKPKEPKDIRTMFRKLLAAIDIEKIKKPWMATKAFKLVTSAAELRAWKDGVLNDKSRWKQFGNEFRPVVAVDTETVGLDTRIVVDIHRLPDGTWQLTYEVKTEIAGVCLSSDGIEGIYVPITHEDGHNIDRAACTEILQELFDQAHLVFYNAKYDREILRLTMGINFRPYPYFEDVQVLQYINDPKADLGDDNGRGKKWTGDSGGLKALSVMKLGIEQIKGEELMKVKADFYDPEKYAKLKADPKNAEWTEEQFKKKATSQRVQYVPFTWVPTEIALWYAGGDAICTWLLWEQMHPLAWSRRLPHRIDHELIDTLTWLERQRFIVDVAHHERTVKWHTAKLKLLRAELREIALRDGFKERTTDEGVVLEDDQFNPDSNPQLGKFLFGTKNLRVIRMGKELPSVDADVQMELRKLYPDDEFLKKLKVYKEYVALHPGNLSYDPKDSTARIYLKQNVVAGGRLSGAGGEFAVDGGFGLNPQGIVRVEGNWWVKGNVLVPDTVNPDEVEEYTEADLHKSCFKTEEKEKDGVKTKVAKKAPGIIKNHIGQYLGYAVCLVPKCKTCGDKHGILIKNGRLDANEVVNIRSAFAAMAGWTFFCIDYSNIEMRAAANISGEKEFVREFLEGKGDFHSLTASKVFPEFNDPNTPKDRKKFLRSLAKIINFALLYGGTQYTIYENMKSVKPDITFKEAEKMVADYWIGVPQFAEWCNNKQKIARDKMTCTTTTGRVIDFQSAMEAQGIHKPTKEEMENYWLHRKLNKTAEGLEKSHKMEEAAKLKAKASAMWKDPETGVRNAGDYNRFIGKIQRVAVNVPVQGLCGDFMRIALNRIRQWATKDPGIAAILRLHCSVHDEVDFQVKNEYVPFVLPRIMRLMKLRKYHKTMNWPVQIECDCEYGRSWDVEHHLTGDDGHKPAAWTAIAGMEEYIPAELGGMATIEKLLAALTSGVEARAGKAMAWMKENLHPRALDAYNLGDPANPKKALIAAFQLHEFWVTDNIPDEDDDKMETLEQYEARMGLSAANRPPAPEMGWLGAVPQDKVTRPTLQILGEMVPVEDVNIIVSGTEIAVETLIKAETAVVVKKLKEAKKVVEDDDVFGETPVRRAKAVSEEPPQVSVKKVETVPAPDGIPELIAMDGDALLRFQKALGVGRKKVTVRYQGKTFTIPDVEVDTVPSEYVRH